MVNKDVSYKLLRSFVRHANSGQPSSIITNSKCRQAQRAALNAGTSSNYPTQPQAVTTTNANENDGDKIFDFEDTKALFASVPTGKLLHSAATLNMAAIEPIVDLSLWVMNSRLMEFGLFKAAVMGTIKHTAYDHFVAGGDTVETGRTVMRLYDSGLRGMLDYGLEHANDNKSCDQAAQQLITTAASTQSLPPSSVSFFIWAI